MSIGNLHCEEQAKKVYGKALAKGDKVIAQFNEKVDARLLLIFNNLGSECDVLLSNERVLIHLAPKSGFHQINLRSEGVKYKGAISVRCSKAKEIEGWISVSAIGSA